MKDCQERWKPDCKNSVILTLMGVDELQTKPSLQQKRRGLSERYIRNAASIGLRHGSLVSLVRLRRTDDVREYVDSSPKGTRYSESAGAPASSSLYGSGYQSIESVGKDDEHCEENVVRRQQELEYRSFHPGGLGIESMTKALVSRFEIIDNTRHFSEPGQTGACNATSLLTRSFDSSSIEVGDNESLKRLPVSEFEATQGNLSDGWNSTQYEPIATENMSNDEDFESKRRKGSEQFQISLGVDETVSPGTRVLELSTCSFSCSRSALNNPETYVLANRDEMYNSLEKDSGKDDELSETAGVSSRSSVGLESESNPGTKLEEGGQSSPVEEVFSIEASLNEYFEEESSYSNLPAVGPLESLENLKKTNQHSPDSVLESCDLKNCSFECFDSAGLQLQLESLNFDSRDTYSDGSDMLISGDEDAKEEFGAVFHDSRKIKRWLGDGQNINFSYMVDVLDEAGFCGMNSYMDLKMWYSLECPICPFVFEALEKKYGKQTSWLKSERQLLFDRINAGLLEIFNPIIYFHAGITSTWRRLCDSFRLDEVVDELWTKLITQEKTKSAMTVGKWLELGEGIDIICREVEALLLDEMTMELF